MQRYRLLMFYEDKATRARVAQTVVVIAESDQAAVQTAKADVVKNAVGGRIQSIQVVEKLPITAGVVFRGEPYIPMHWPGS
jgi:hypothetical protein